MASRRSSGQGISNNLPTVLLASRSRWARPAILQRVAPADMDLYTAVCKPLEDIARARYQLFTGARESPSGGRVTKSDRIAGTPLIGSRARAVRDVEGPNDLVSQARAGGESCLDRGILRSSSN